MIPLIRSIQFTVERCPSSLLSDPNANFSVEMWRRSNIRRAATSALTFMTF